MNDVAHTRAIDAIQVMRDELELLRQSDANADLVISMLVHALNEVKVVGATTKLRRDIVRGALEFANAHLGETG